MPGRGHKVASRQAQLGNRKRRQNRTPSAVPARPRAASVAPSAIEPVETDEAAPQPAVATAPSAPAARPAPRSSAQYHPIVLDHIGRELRRIGALGMTALGVLIVISIVVL